jgi:hypothetical protein
MAKSKRDVWKFNFAELESVRELVKEEIVPMLERVREQRRQQLEQDWKEFFMMWNVTHDEHHTYAGRAKLYVPETRKNVEAQARQLTEAAFPNEDFFDVSPGLTGTKKGATAWKSIMRYHMERADLRVKFLPFARQECLYGTSPAYVPWSRITNQAFMSARDKKTGKIRPTRKLIEQYNGPDFVPRDLFHWYAINPKVPDLRDGCFEDMVVGYFELIRREKDGNVARLKDILAGSSDAYREKQMQNDIERIEAMDLPLGAEAYGGQAVLSKDDEESENGAKTWLCSRVYLEAIIPEACDEGEDPELPIPLQIEIYNNEHIGLVRRNGFWHQRPPYVVGKYILPNADEYYGQGIPHATRFQQHEMNSTAEQAMDSKTLALNPIAFIDPALAAQLGDLEVEPGAKWFIRPDGVKFGALPDLTSVGYQAIAQLRGQMQEYSDRAPALPPQLLGKSRTATQSEIVDRAVSVDLKTFQIQNEILVLQPLLKQWESLCDQNMKDDQVIMILGRRSTDWQKRLIEKASTLGSYEYFWKVSSHIQNKQIVARQIIDLVKVAAVLPPGTVKMDVTEVFRALWSEQFNLPDADKVFGGEGDMQSTDPAVELKMLQLGLQLEVLPADDDTAHLRAHDAQLKSLKDPDEKGQLEMHMLQHAQQLRAKQQAMQAKAAMMQQMIAAQAQAQGKGAQGSGNRTQLSPNGSVADQASGVRA